MSHNYIQKATSSFKLKITTIIIVITLLLYSLFYFSIQNSIKVIKEDIDHRLHYIEVHLEQKFSDTEYIFYNFANLISKQFIYSNNQMMEELFSWFIRKPRSKLSIPLRAPVFIDDKTHYHFGIDPQKNLNKTLLLSPPRFLKTAAENPFKLYINNIHYGEYLQRYLIPLSIGIINENKKYVGTIWSSILIKPLNEQLNGQYGHPKYLGKITLLNNKKNDPESDYVFHKLDEAISFEAILKAVLHNYDLTIHKNLTNYPFTIEFNIKPLYFLTFLGLNIFLHTILLGLLILFLSISYKIITNYYQIPLRAIYNKMHFITTRPKEVMKESDSFFASNQFSLKKFTQNINALLDHYYLLREENERRPEVNLRKKILDLALTEQHFLSSKKNNIAREDKLYLNKLLNIIDEAYTTAFLGNYLKEVTNYCCEFYHEVNCEIIVEKKHDIAFDFKYTALTETIFNIFTFIIRSHFEIIDNAIIIKGSFVKKQAFPIITIEVTLSDDASTTLGWMSGPNYVYSGLLSIHLAAKENNLILNIKRKDNKILFILESMADKVEFYKKAFEDLSSTDL